MTREEPKLSEIFKVERLENFAGAGFEAAKAEPSSARGLRGRVTSSFGELVSRIMQRSPKSG